jgi:hypothetical protein
VFTTTKSVESLKIDDATMTLSDSSVGTGSSLGITLDLDYSFAEYESYGGYAELVGSGGEVYSLGSFYANGGSVISFEVAIPQNLAPGNYKLKVFEIYTYIDDSYSGDYLNDFSSPIIITAQSSVEDQLQELKDQNADLQSQVENLTEQLDATQSSVDDKFDGTMGMITMVLVIVVLLVVVIQLVLMMRKKP